MRALSFPACVALVEPAARRMLFCLGMPDPVISAAEAAPAAPAELSRRQLAALLEVSEAIAQQRYLPALFHDLAARRHSAAAFAFLTLILHDAARNVMRPHILGTA